MDLGVLDVLGVDVGVAEVFDGGVHRESLSQRSFFLLAGLGTGVLQLDFGSQYVFGSGADFGLLGLLEIGP